MVNLEMIIEQNPPACEVQAHGLDIEKLMDKGVIAIAGVRNGCCFKYEFTEN